ncbi:phosphoadenylyl-sulfate reductase [Gordonia sp. ABSL11-1]|uniref:phosphoadenylyl-sulfate reductase n=1 Tax=Gordonia sp. ABSL11-1 TaxID=3053924 RepID=UPI002573B201|nr:phosphoadenylyl-sulfate reductase [Gordonia sp. ABSL11-1]MDL9944242.1 phosphoadenylyl-sulfate reductase [Gordonia sp. ABSL11-1]
MTASTSATTGRRHSESELRTIAEKGARDLGLDASPQELIRWTAETFGDNFVVASNMQDAALVDLSVEHVDRELLGGSPVKVLFLDTGYHFAETIGTRDAVEQVYGVEMVNLTPENSVAEQDDLLGRNLFARDPGECCRLRKVVPLKAGLAHYDAWITGIRRVEAPTRANAPLISFDEGFGLVKINPIAAWSDETMQDYIDRNGVLVNPLVDDGYPSIGCAPCTAKPEPGSDPRSGRWAGRAKTECGLHA